MDSTIVVAVISATGAVLVALIGAGWIARRRTPAAAGPDPDMVRQLEIEQATAELYREQRDEARADLLEEQESRSLTIAELERERRDHALTRRLLDDCARQKDGVTSMLRMVERQLAGWQHGGPIEGEPDVR